MALINLTSDLTWTGTMAQNTTTPYAQPNLSNTTQPPSVNYLDNLNAIGFTTFESELAPSRFTGVAGEPGSMTYTYTGVNNLGTLGIENNFTDNDAIGFTTNEAAGPNPESRFVGVTGAPGAMSYTHTGNEGLGSTDNALGVNYFPNLNATGFTTNMFPAGGEKQPSQYIGIAGAQGSETYEYPNNAAEDLGNLAKNIRQEPSEFETYTPSVGNYGTKFIYDGENSLIVSAPDAQGFDRYGETIINHVMSTPSKDDFAIDDVSFSNRGIAKRKTQLGNGSKFPISYNGALHSFDQIRTGFHPDSKYEDTFGNQVNDGDNTNAGLANTYVAESPIDDMYNKFNLRDDATPNPGYAKQPLILRGIQREGSIDPQRWGLNNTTGGKISSIFGIPRAGILAAGERAAIDVARISKYLISPKGLGFLVKQFGLQLTNPNTENIVGGARGLPLTQLYNPLSSPVQAIAGIIGMHTKRHGIPIVGGSEYGKIKNKQIEGYKAQGIKPTGGGYGNNRLLNLMQNAFGAIKKGAPPKIPEGTSFNDTINILEALPPILKTPIGMPFPTLSAGKGPGSVFGIGATNLRRYVDTSLVAQRESTSYTEQMLPGYSDTAGVKPTLEQPEVPEGKPVGLLEQNKFYYGSDEAKIGGLLTQATYQAYRGATSDTFSIQEVDDGDNRKNKTWTRNFDKSGTPHVAGHDSLKKELKRSLQYKGVGGSGTEPSLPSVIGMSEEKDGFHALNTYVTMTYGAIPDKSAGSDTKTYDFRVLGREANNLNDESDLGSTYKPTKGQVQGVDYGSDDSTVFNKFVRESGPDMTTYDDFQKMHSPDPIQKLKREDISSTDTDAVNDLIKFKFVKLKQANSISTATSTDKNYIIFRAFLSDLSDSFTPSWTPSLDQGRADAKILYSSWERTITVSFTVPILSLGEHGAVWTKLNDLASLTYPVYATNGFTGQYVAVTIGDLYVNQPMYIISLDYAWDTETPWEIKNTYQTPHYTTVDITFGYIGRKRPEAGSTDPYDVFKDRDDDATADADGFLKNYHDNHFKA